MTALAAFDPEVFAATQAELHRQQDGLELIASENFVSAAVLEAAATVLTNKYAEGVPGKRYYGGCAHVDVVETLACERAKQLFGAGYANAQPHSGSQANMAVYMHALSPGDTMLAMDLNAGGHLTHGAAVSFSGRLYRVVPYGVRRDTETIDYDEMEALARTHRPKLIIAGASAYPRIIDFARFGAIAREMGARLMVDMAHIAGLVAVGLHPSPVPHADYVTTTTHKTLRGPRGGMILAQAQYGKELDSAVCPRIQGGPLMHIIAAKAVALKEAMAPEFAEYQRRVVANCNALAQALSGAGLRLVSGGTDNHLALIDLRPWGLTGKVAEHTLDAVGITVNKNKIPFDPEKPMVTSGIRVGTAALTTRGFGSDDMPEVAELICRALKARDDAATLQKLHREVRALAARFPLYADRGT